MENFKLLCALFYRPHSAMSDILDNGRWLWAAAFVLLAAAVFSATINARLYDAYRIPQLEDFIRSSALEDDADPDAFEAELNRATAEYEKAQAERKRIPVIGDYFFRFFSFEPEAFYRPLIILSVFYVPLVILLAGVFGTGKTFSVSLQNDYGALATCALMAWAAAHLPFAVGGILLRDRPVSPSVLLALWALSSLYFGVLMLFALRRVFGASYSKALLIVGAAWLAFSAGMHILDHIPPLLFSPFLLFWGYQYFGGRASSEVRGFGNAFRQRQNLKRFLHNATVNPRDADARVQLGLIYLQRRQTAKAQEYFRQAIEIDSHEIDANYQLGKLARQNGELPKAIEYFSVVIEQNDKHAFNEIWREIGATYLAADMPNEARQALETFIARRPVDVEGLYYLGTVLAAQGDAAAAAEKFRQAVENARTSPDYRKAELRHWSKLAQKSLVER